MKESLSERIEKYLPEKYAVCELRFFSMEEDRSVFMLSFGEKRPRGTIYGTGYHKVIYDFDHIDELKRMELEDVEYTEEEREALAFKFMESLEN